MTTPIEKARQIITEWIARGNYEDAIHISYLRLSELPEDLFAADELKNLKALYIRCNKLTTLPKNIFSGLSALQILYIDHNELTVLPENIFSGLSALQKLVISNNNLTILPENIFSGLFLRYLTLYKNPFIIQIGTYTYENCISLLPQLFAAQRDHMLKLARERSALIAEELAAVAWSPKRVEKWLAVGFDPEDW